MRGFIYGIVFTIALLAAAAFTAVKFGVVYAGADRKPPRLERMAAQMSLHAAIDRDTKGLDNPLKPTDANLIAGVHLYGNNCAICHGAADAKKSTLATGFYIKAPQLADDGVEDDPQAETYWKLKHGIRFTAMPAFGSTLSDEQLWQITMFVATMDKLPPAVDAVWKKIPTVAASPLPAGMAVPAAGGDEMGGEPASGASQAPTNAASAAP